jgi:ABC-type Zn uptake system ZnuABC Zn-binding protein ZnuA
MGIGKGLFIFIMFGLFSTLSARGTEVLKVVTFSTVLTEIAGQVGGNRLSVNGLIAPGSYSLIG